MKTIKFTKLVASGNDFVVIEGNHKSLAKEICDRKYGVGADGLLLLEKSQRADIRMRVFNADGSEAEMCGNGARAAALYYSRRSPVAGHRSKLKIETKAGIIAAEVAGDRVKIKLTDPQEYQKKIPLKICGRKIRANFINTGVPHTVVFVEGIKNIDVSNLGREIRYHGYFAPAGTNVNFVEVLNKDTIQARTYERGVEGETLACGTGSAASAIVSSLQSPCLALPDRQAGGRQAVSSRQLKINVITQGGETLKVYFSRKEDKIFDVWLEGQASIVYRGEYYV